MPKQLGLSAMQRIQIMDDRLRKDKWWTRDALFHEVNRHLEASKNTVASNTTLRGDLETIQDKAGDNLLCEMRQANGKVRKSLHYRYSDPDYSYFGALPLNTDEFEVLQQAIELLEQIKADEVADELKGIIQKLKFKYETPLAPRVLYEQPDLQGIELMKQLYEAIRDRKVIGFKYQPFDQKEPQDFLLHPYVLKEYNKRWYVVGLAEPQKEIWVCAFDRFKSDPKVKLLSFKEPTAVGFNPETYFKDVIGPTVRKENPVEEVVLKFKANRAPYIITKKLHQSQELLKAYKDGSVSFAYQLRFNRELLALLMSFGPDVMIMKPESLKEKVTNTAEAILGLY